MQNKHTLSQSIKDDITGKIDALISGGCIDEGAITGEKIEKLIFLNLMLRDFFLDDFDNGYVAELNDAAKEIHYDILGAFALLKKAGRNFVSVHSLLDVSKLISDIKCRLADINISSGE